jgi:hypothetical protein
MGVYGTQYYYYLLNILFFKFAFKSHSMLQKSTNQFERATGMHVAAKSRVFEAERRVFGGGNKRAFDSAIQEMLNQATIEVRLP